MSGPSPSPLLPAGSLTCPPRYGSRQIEVLSTENPTPTKARATTAMPSSGTPPVGGSGLLDVVLSTTSLGSSTPPPSSFPPPFSPPPPSYWSSAGVSLSPPSTRTSQDTPDRIRSLRGAGLNDWP